MKRLFSVIVLAIISAGLLLLGLGDTAISVDDTGIPDNEITTSQTEASDCSASATIMITMYAVPDE